MTHSTYFIYGYMACITKPLVTVKNQFDFFFYYNQYIFQHEYQSLLQ